MLPEQKIVYADEIEVSSMPSKTWRIDFEKKKVEEIIDQEESMSQAIDLLLETVRYEELILPDWYGNELWTLIGQDIFYIESEAQRMVKEALLVDDRIKDIKDFTILPGEEKDAILIRFTAVTIFGNIEASARIER